MHTRPDTILKARLWNFALIKSMNWMRNLLWALVIWHPLSHKTEAGRRGRQGEEEEDSDRGEDSEGRTRLTADSLSDLLVGYRTKGWSMREKERETVTERETDRYQLYLCGLILIWSAWWLLLINLWLFSHSFTHAHKHTNTHSQYKKTQHANTRLHAHTQQHTQNIYLLFCDFGGLLALRTLWRLQWM